MKNQKIYHNEIFVISLLFVVSFGFLLFAISNLSISFYEADILYNEKSLTSLVANLSCKFFGYNDFALRIPFIFIHFANCILLYKISKFMLKRRFDRVLSLILYMCLPGVLTSAIVVNPAGIVIFITLLILYFESTNLQIPLFITLFISLFVDKSFSIFYICLFLYAAYYRKKELAIASILLFVSSVIFYEVGTSGKPRGYFLDTIGIYAAAFSPAVLFIFIYTIYRIWLKDRKNLLWFVVSGTFCLSLIFSLRQKLELGSLLPFCVISAPLMVRVFLNSYRIRLPEFRKPHKISAVIAILFLLISANLIIFNQIFYQVLFKDKPQKHFIFKYDIIKDLSLKLKKQGIYGVDCQNYETQLRLKFYGIEKNPNLMLFEDEVDFYDSKIEVRKFGNLVDEFYIKKAF